MMSTAPRSIRTRLSGFFLLLLLMPATALGEKPAAQQEPVDYNRDIRPILSNRCYTCHGPDANERKAELRLDVRDAAEHVLSPGEPDESALLERISSTDPDLRMPPVQSKKPGLSAEEIALFRRWIEQGARFAEHWAYVPITRPEVPEAASDWPARNAVDHFVMARFEKEGLTPAEEADRRTLIRRLYFDLTGLPPSFAEVQAFVEDDSPEAYEKVVDRLLASQHYGERMALYWLDLVRYADTNGIHGDNHREHWLYRDYVIDAFNNNKPFDQFTVEQLAGDLLKNPSRQSRIASGYNRLNLTTREGGAQPKEYMAKYSADRVRNASAVWLGATMGCSECHDHKFDPYTMRDFYSFAAFFADVQETAVGTQQATKMPTQEQLAEKQKSLAQIDKLQKIIDTPTPELAKGQAAWEKEIASQLKAWSVAEVDAVKSDGGTAFKTLSDGSVLASGKNPASDTFTVTLSTDLPRVTGLRLEALADVSLPKSGPGRAGNGNFVLSEVQLEGPDLLGELQPLELTAPRATFSQEAFPVEKTIDGKSDQASGGWAILPQAGKSQAVVYRLAKPLASRKENEAIPLRLTLIQQHGSSHTMGRFRVSFTGESPPAEPMLLDKLPQPVVALLKLSPQQRTEKQQAELATYYRSIAPALKPQRDEIARLRGQVKSLENSFPEVLVSVSVKPRTMRILPRGNWLDDSGPVVQPAVPEFLGATGPADERLTRKELAEWIVDPKNPLVARVQVNRFWKLLFGEGLVPTMDDFGSQGRVPSHPKLLDWLAAEFIDSGWDVKHMMKLIAMSHTYRQSSSTSRELMERDPQNRLLARQGRFRLPAEMVRDNALAISGLLVDKVGGPSAKPYQPAGYWSHLNFPKRTYRADTNENQYRRGLYTYWCRTFLHPSLLAFDAPTREECAVKRPRSNTPLQALVLLNDPTYVEAARALAERVLRASGSDIESRIDTVMQSALARRPSSEERKILTEIYQRHLEQYQADPKAAAAVHQTGMHRQPEDLDAAELAALTSVARVVLNLHETITRK